MGYSIADEFDPLRSTVEELVGEGTSFADAATQALSEFLQSRQFSWEEKVDALLQSEELPAQQDIGTSFGEPCLTVAQGADFYIQLLYWCDGSTQVHEHSFSGAFAVLDGSSVHTSYALAGTERTDEKSDSRVDLGFLQHTRVEILRPGQARPIRRGKHGIHQVFHLERPTLSIVVRTRSQGRQRSFYPEQHAPGGSELRADRGAQVLACDPMEGDERERRVLQHLDLLVKLDPEKAVARANELVAAAPPWLAFESLRLLTERGLHSSVRPLSKRLDSRLCNGRSLVHEVLQTVASDQNIAARRKVVQDPSHRLLIGLLRVARDGESLLGLVSETSETRDPVASVQTWLGEICRKQVSPEWGPNALGVELNDRDLAFITRILRGETLDQAADLLGATPQEAARWTLALPKTQVLAPIFR